MALVRSRYPLRRAGGEQVALTAMLEAYRDLVEASYDAVDAELKRLRNEEPSLSMAAIADALGVSRQAIAERVKRLFIG